MHLMIRFWFTRNGFTDLVCGRSDFFLSFFWALMLIYLLLMIGLDGELASCTMSFQPTSEQKPKWPGLNSTWRSGSVLMLQFSSSIVAYHSTCAIMGFVVLESHVAYHSACAVLEYLVANHSTCPDLESFDSNTALVQYLNHLLPINALVHAL